MRHRLSLATELNLGYNTRSPPHCQAFFADFFGLFMQLCRSSCRGASSPASRMCRRTIHARKRNLWIREKRSAFLRVLLIRLTAPSPHQGEGFSLREALASPV